jgi:hypothetical protein
MNIATTRNLTDSALAYLVARPGEQFDTQHIADFFECHVTTMRKVLNRLVNKQEIMAKKAGKTHYWFDQAKKAPKAEPRSSQITHKVYALPAVLAERGREIQSSWEAFPSRHI